MKKIQLQDVRNCLDTLEGEVKVEEQIRLAALKAVEKMISLNLRLNIDHYHSRS